MKNTFIFLAVLLGIVALGASFLFGYNYGKTKGNIDPSSESMVLKNDNSFNEDTVLEEILLQQPCYVENTNLSECLYDGEYRLNIIIKNNSEIDIKTVTIAYAAWDTNNLPLQTSIYSDFNNYWSSDERAYIQKSNYEDANILAKKTSREDDNMIIESTVDIGICKAIVVSYTDYKENTWENPYYQTWLQAYEGKKLEK